MSFVPEAVDVVNTEDEDFNSFSDSIIDQVNVDLATGTAGLSDEAFAAITSLSTQEDFETAAAALLPDLSNASTREVFESIGQVSNTIGQRISSLTNAGAVGNTSIASENPFRSVDAVYSVDENGKGEYVLPVQASVSGLDLSARTGLWLQGSFTNSEQDNESDANVLDTGFSARTDSYSLGFDFALADDTLVGVSVTDTSIDIDQDRLANDESDIDLVQLNLYGAKQYGALQLNAQLSYVDGDVDSTRTALGSEISADYDIDGYSLQVEGNYAFKLGKTGYITPLLRLSYSDISSDSFTEDGGLNATVSGFDDEFFEAELGFRLGERIVTASSLVDLYLTASVVTEFGGDSDNVSVSFANQTTTLSTFDADDERLELGVGVNWYASDSVSFGASLNGQVSDDFYNVDGQVQVKFNF